MRKLKKQTHWFSARFKVGLVLFLIILGGGIYISFTPFGQAGLSAVSAFYQQLIQKAHLQLDQVIVEGHTRTTLEQIKQNLNFVQGMPIFDVDLTEAHHMLLSLPWVKTAVVERHLPAVEQHLSATIHIKLTEKKPIAVWQNKKKYFPLDENGKIIADNTTVLTGLILIVGADAPEKTPVLMQQLSAVPALFERVRSAVRVGNRRWNLILDDVDTGLIIYLPDTGVETALQKVTELDKKEGLLNKDLKIIDVRLPDRLIIRTNAQDIQKQKKSRGAL